MYLSRVRLNVQLRETMKALASPSIVHGAVESSFAGERMRRLWRIDTLSGEPYLLILSENRPNLEKLAQDFGYAGDYLTKSYDPLLARVTNGGSWRFRLVANPTVAQAVSGKRGKVVAHITPEYQKQWLLQKAASHGFALDEASLLVTQVKWQRFYKGRERAHRVCLLSVAYTGILQVTNAALFRQTLCEGIGREKAYGMGLLTIVGV